MKRILLLTTLALVTMSSPHPARGEDAVQAWVQFYNGPADSIDVAKRVAVDSSGNVVVAGYSDSKTNGYDWLTIKYSGAGVPLWTNRYDTGGGDEVSAVGVDSSGNVFVTGASGASGAYDCATIKYSVTGVPLWTNLFNVSANGDAYPSALAVDGDGNAFVTGRSGGTIKYSGAGVPLWTNQFGGRASAIAVDSSGDVVVTGWSGNYITIKYSGAGVPLWTKIYGGPYNDGDYATALAVDGSGNVIVTGFSLVSVYYDSTDDYFIYDYDYATIKYSGAGVPLWTNLYHGPGNADYAYAVAVDGDGNVFVTGSSQTSVQQNGIESISSSEYATIKYSAAGVPLWERRYTGPANIYDFAYALAVDGGGNVFVTGNSLGSGSSEDFATIKYSGAGVALWTNRFNGTANGSDWAEALAVDGSGNVLVTGGSWDGTNHNFATIKYSSVVPPLLTIARTTTNTIAISWPSPSTGFTLQQNTNSIATLNWSNVLTTPTDNGTTRTVIVNPASGSRYFRLKSQ